MIIQQNSKQMTLAVGNMWENKGLLGCYGDVLTTKTSCNETCKCTTDPNESHGKKEEAQTMESDQIQPTVTGGLE
jgi:hypothetical protein